MLLCAEKRYLSETPLHETWVEEARLRDSKTHPARTYPATGTRVECNPGLFWSLAFGVRRALFHNLGGFDERFIGYGGEDTDFGFRAHRAGGELVFLGGTGAFHHYHETYEPSLRLFEDIFRNAEIFFGIWAVWPMKGWPDSFESLGLICVKDSKIITVRSPNVFEIEMARSNS